MKIFANTSMQTKFLLYLSAFVGLGAYFGGFVMIISQDGMCMGMKPMLYEMQSLPFAEILFQNFLFSGIMLILINGICNTLTVIGLLKKKPYGILCGLLSGILLICWLSVQWVIFAVNGLTTLYTVFGLLQIGLACNILRKKKQMLSNA